MHCF